MCPARKGVPRKRRSITGHVTPVLNRKGIKMANKGETIKVVDGIIRVPAATKYEWDLSIPGETFMWPEGVTIIWLLADGEDGEEYFKGGHTYWDNESQEWLTQWDEEENDGKGTCGSPCHQVLMEAGLLPNLPEGLGEAPEEEAPPTLYTVTRWDGADRDEDHFKSLSAAKDFSLEILSNEREDGSRDPRHDEDFDPGSATDAAELASFLRKKEEVDSALETIRGMAEGESAEIRVPCGWYKGWKIAPLRFS
jgi:hypothetical protein